jgi:hypothetical protein
LKISQVFIHRQNERDIGGFNFELPTKCFRPKDQSSVDC